MQLEETTVLFVEDEEFARNSISKILSKKVSSLITATDGLDGLNTFRCSMPHIVITDLEMPVMNGIEMIDAIKSEKPETPVIVITAFKDQACLAQNADVIIHKPITRNQLMTALNKCVDKL